MHAPSTTPHPSLYYRYRIYPPRPAAPPPGEGASAPVVIVGAGPVGLLTAIDLARFGVACIIVEQDVQVSHGSRAIVLTRRSLEILQQNGVEQRFLEKGLPWSFGRSFYRGKEVYRMVMPHDANDRFLPGLNLQQQYMEEYLVDACESSPLIDVRWGQKVIGISQTPHGVRLQIDSAEGEWALSAEWVIAADGGRSTLRKLSGMRMEGRSYPGHFVIADIKADIDLPTERLCFFDPDWNPGNNVLVHRQPEGMWRIDYRLPDGETPEQALEATLLHARIDAVLAMLGQTTRWALDWATVYSANTLTLPAYVDGRLLFTGDAAHLLPIFGVRGCNTGIQDCNNLAWKLAFVVRGWSDRRLLDTYTSERVQAAREICEEGGKSTRFMSPPTAGARLMRDAVLSFALSEDFCKDLLHWRTSRAHDYASSPLNSAAVPGDAFSGGISCGQAVRNVRFAAADYLLDRLGARAGFHLLIFTGDDDLGGHLADLLSGCAGQPFPVIRVVIGPAASHVASRADLAIADDEGLLAAAYDARPGTVYLLRPDLHVCARWRHADGSQVGTALRTAACAIDAAAEQAE